MRKIIEKLTVLLVFVSNIAFSQIPCSTGFNANGSSDFITIPNTDAINLQNTRNRTVEFWIKPSDITSRQVIYEEGAQVNTLFFYIEAGRVYAGAYRNNAGIAADRRMFRSAIGDITVDKWTHVALTLEDTTTPDLTFKFYLNGELKDTQAGLQVNTHSGNNSIARNGGGLRFPTSIANNWTSSSEAGSTTETYTNTFTGRIDNAYSYDGAISLLRIWNVARTSNQISDNKSSELTSGTSLVAYQEGDQIHYEASGSNSINGLVTANGSATTYTWNGNNSSNYSDNANWIGSTPDPIRTQTVIINSASNTPEITSEVNIGRLTLNAGAEILVKDGGTLHVYYSLTNNGVITVEDGGSLIYHACNSPISGAGTFDIQRATPDYNEQFFFSYWSSPVIESDANPTEVFANAPVVFRFLAIEENSDWVANAGANLKPGVGYAIRNENTGGDLRTFSGKINEGSVAVDVFYSSNLESEDEDNSWSTEGDNLVGNPYASAIDWEAIITDEDNADIEGTVYFWNQNSVETGDNNVADYLQYNLTGGSSNTATGNIASGQGFFIRTLQNSKITFKTTHQIAANNNQFFKGSVKTDDNNGRSWFTLTRGDKTNTLLVGFLNGATNDFDRVYDAPFNINQTSLGFYSIIENNKDKVSIQGLPELTDNTKEVKLGYIVDAAGEHTIGIQEEHINENYFIYLKDTETGIVTDLRKTSYTFTVNTLGENNTRFQLIYTKDELKEEKKVLSTIDETVEEHFLIYVNTVKQLIVNTDTAIDKVAIYTIEGREVKSYLGSQVKNVSDLKTGVYVVEVELKNNTSVINKKIIIDN